MILLGHARLEVTTTTLSRRGQIVIPKTLRESRRWVEGTEFIVEAVPEGLLLKPLSPFPATCLEDVMLLELEWVLRAASRLTPPAIQAAMVGLCGLPNLTLEDPSQVAQAVADHAQGLAFADALHLASSTADEGMFSFDAAIVNAAKAAGRTVRLAGGSRRRGATTSRAK